MVPLAESPANSKNISNAPLHAEDKKENTSEKNTDTAIVVNPSSCSGLTGKNWDELFAKIKSILGEQPVVKFSGKAGEATVITRDLLDQGFKKILAIGGDGTINEVANGFFVRSEHKGTIIKDTVSDNDNGNIHGKSNNSKAFTPLDGKFQSYGNTIIDDFYPINPTAIMAVIPCGTRNVLVRSLDLPAGVVESCHNYVNGHPKKIDVIAAVATDAETGLSTEPRVFLNAAEIGVGAEIISRSKEARKKINSRLVSTIAGIISTLPTYESNLCEILIENGNEKILTKMTMGVIANGKFLGGGFKAAPEANISDGLLDIVILKNSDSITMLDEFINIKNGDYTQEGNIIYLQARKVSLMSKERKITVTVDGEPIGILPATFQVLEKALTIQF